jgi:hypothetical protein
MNDSLCDICGIHNAVLTSVIDGWAYNECDECFEAFEGFGEELVLDIY